MSKEIYISSTPHETRLAIVENDELTEIYYERENEYTLAGSIYKGKVTRVLPGMQSSFVDIGLERDAFLYITDFMEEAADTADFDHGTEGVRPRLGDGQRNDSTGDRDRESHRGNGNSQQGEYVSERNREYASATPASDYARASEGRGEEGNGRNDRGGRGRGRGRRDRGDRNPELSSAGRTADAGVNARFAEPVADETIDTDFGEEQRAAATSFSSVSPATNDSPVGEGAPGADGSRRWRGRRGRRRGRSAGPDSAMDQSGLEPADQAGVAGNEFLPGDGEEPSAYRTEGSPEGESSIAHTITPLRPAHSEAPQGMSRDRSRERGPRPERGDRGQRPERGGRDQRELRVPRGFAPKRDLYGVDSSESAAPAYGETIDDISAAAAEPIILPGESLSKYRKGSPEATASAAPAASATSVSDSGFRVDSNWDGGAILPGETLSRYRGGSAPANTSGARSGYNRNSGSSYGRREEGFTQNRADAQPSENRELGDQVAGQTEKRSTATGMLIPSAVPAEDLQSHGPVSGYASQGETSEHIEAHQPDFLHAELPAATAEAPSMEDAGLAHNPANVEGGSLDFIEAAQTDGSSANAEEQDETEQEYEPEGRSVTYRVDPSAPSEYRQSAPALVQEDGGYAAEAASLSQEVAEASAEAQQSGELAGVSAGQDEDDGNQRSSTADDQESEPAEAGPLTARSEFHEAAVHEVTTLHPTGTMESDPAMQAEPAARDEDAPEFAPSAGDLHEDLIEDEEMETANLQAHSVEEFDDFDEEEEPLEGAADLGLMIRDMSVDQITRTERDLAGADEDEDFEEDTLEDDGERYEEGSGSSDDAGSDVAEEDFSESSPMRDEPAESPVAQQANGFASSPARDGGRSRRDAGRRGGRDRNGEGDGRGRMRHDQSGSSPDGGGYGREGSSDRGGSYERNGGMERARNTGGASDRDRGRSSGRGGRQSMQMTNLPAISDLLKPGQEILCQIAKEPIAKKGARITSHIALPGRFLVFMPTVSHTGVSRKIESDSERRRLKEILLSEKGEASGGFIVRTAAAGASEEELRSDLRFLLNLWADIKQRSETSKSPSLIYHDLNLVERILRDQVTDNFSAIWVDTETEYERVLRFLQRFQPGLIRRVKLYTKETPLFEQFGITEEINKALRSKVWLKSGGSIVINQTEALVAIDINTGKYVGKTARLEDTIVKTNLDAIPEIVRQIRLRDLGGIIIIDFIDMDERKNRNRVMAALEEELKSDRAPSKVLPFNDFGLVAITRKRVKQSLERTLSTTCPVCTGTGMVKSPVTVCNDIYIEMRKMHKNLDRGDVMLRVNPEVVKQLKSTGTKWLQEMEEMCGKTILIKSDPSLHPEQFDIH